ncbi:GTPase ObgE [Lujinxingia vulgaris]|uniref:GTPase Obg n=1 Tax=Lujinxingia vulgaris TaxID=2600176 RepID=A0A5C6XHC8_9DELT|nr:GTPase ObgE [Lujinxingia vulgaris]TXD40814.1 GTPase ObgE [Lujinxingia vulgaris]
MFVDEAKVEVRAGRGGDGALAFRREKFVPRGGPAGGDGGRGGSVIVRATHNANTLADYRHRRTVRAEDGRPGGGDNKTGRNGEDAWIEVPVGTLIHDAKTGELLADLMEDGEEFVVAKGGDGGQGNARFATSTNRAPRRHTPGFAGEERLLRLELKLIADIGLVGFPSVGKSTIISVISSARPKIADYPFTTIVPNLGVVKWKNLREFVVADIPGLIEGAHSGQGLGIQFLRHVERTNLLVHVLEVTPQLEDQPDGRDPIGDYEVIVGELKKFNPELLERPQMVVLNKIDLPYVAEREEELRAHFEDELGLPFIAISAAAAINLDELKDRLGEAIAQGDFGEELEHWER